MHELEKKLDQMSGWYLNKQLDFDKCLLRFRYQSLKPYLTGPEGLELGPAEGYMTQWLVNDFQNLTLVEGSLELLNRIPNHPKLTKIHSLFEDFEPSRQFHSIILDHVLEHVDQPVHLLERLKKWLAPHGRILVGVPNGHSIHRLAAVKMGLLSDPCELNQRDHDLGHYRVYNPETFRKDLEKSDLLIKHLGGSFLKPLSNQQIQDHWSEEMIQGFYELGKDFPEYAADLFAVCEVE